MSAACQTNPLQHFIAKTDQNQRFYGSQLGSSRQQFRQNNVNNGRNTLEQQFLGHTESHNGLLELQHPAPMVPPVNGMGKDSRDEEWLKQFSTVRIDDPLEFSQEYKNLYRNYESSQYPAPRQLQGLQNFDHSMNVYRQNLSNQFNRFSQSEGPNNSYSHRFDEEFKNLEKELQRGESLESFEMYENNVSYEFDDEQMEFQKIANTIVDSCSSISNSPSPVSSKLSSSKFMGLMRGISEGSITLKKDNQRVTEFHSPENGERIGNEYFPVLEKIHSTKKL